MDRRQARDDSTRAGAALAAAGMLFAHMGRSLKWWYWLAAGCALAVALAGWAPALPLALAIVAVQIGHFLLRERRVGAFSVQVPLSFLALLALGLWGPLGFIHWLALAGTWIRLVFDYCPLARIMSLAPWNRDEPLSWPLVRRTFLTPPVKGPFLAGVPGGRHSAAPRAAKGNVPGVPGEEGRT